MTTKEKQWARAMLTLTIDQNATLKKLNHTFAELSKILDDKHQQMLKDIEGFLKRIDQIEQQSKEIFKDQ